MSALEEALGSARPWIVGVLNVTPDSFSDGGRFLDPAAAIAQGRRLASDGAVIIDIGGESTAPGAEPVSAAEELRRIAAPVEALAREFFVSVDTYKAEVAEACLRRGARMINDVSAARADPEMAAVIKRHACFAVIMHSKESAAHPGATDAARRYGDLVEEIAAFLLERIESLRAAGVSPGRIVADPGMGRFLSLDAEVSWEAIRRLGALQRRLAPVPLLVGVSRKGFLGGGREDRDALSQLAALAAWRRGADLIRTHNPAMLREFLRIARLAGLTR